MKKDIVCKYYKSFLRYYFPTILFIVFIITFWFKWLPLDCFYVGLTMTIAAEIGMYVDYVRYKNKV